MMRKLFKNFLRPLAFTLTLTMLALSFFAASQNIYISVCSAPQFRNNASTVFRVCSGLLYTNSTIGANV